MKNLLGRGLTRTTLFVASALWQRIPPPLRSRPLACSYATHLHALVRRHAVRRQYFGTFFFRNRPELELIGRLTARACHGSSWKISVLACSKGAEVYSIAWTIRSVRPDLKVTLHAVDISSDILAFAEAGVYSLSTADVPHPAPSPAIARGRDVTWNTCRDQNAPLFERMTDAEMQALFDRHGDQVSVKLWLRAGISWHRADAGDPDLPDLLGPQDLVVANRFLCHMAPRAAERCLRNIARLVAPGGYLIVSGVDLDLRTRVAQEHGWRPVTELLREIHDGDPSLRRGWPLEYWGLEPFEVQRRASLIRYASVFQLGEANPR